VKEKVKGQEAGAEGASETRPYRKDHDSRSAIDGKLRKRRRRAEDKERKVMEDKGR